MYVANLPHLPASAHKHPAPGSMPSRPTLPPCPHQAALPRRECPNEPTTPLSLCFTNNKDPSTDVTRTDVTWTPTPLRRAPMWTPTQTQRHRRPGSAVGPPAVMSSKVAELTCGSSGLREMHRALPSESVTMSAISASGTAGLVRPDTRYPPRPGQLSLAPPEGARTQSGSPGERSDCCYLDVGVELGHGMKIRSAARVPPSCWRTAPSSRYRLGSSYGLVSAPGTSQADQPKPSSAPPWSHIRRPAATAAPKPARLVTKK